MAGRPVRLCIRHDRASIATGSSASGENAPRFWLFQSGRPFVARASDTKLQVVAATPRDAIEALRQAMREYRRRYFVRAVDGDPLPLRMRPQPAAVPARAAYELSISRLARENGFWVGAEVFCAEAVRFTSRCAAGSARSSPRTL